MNGTQDQYVHRSIDSPHGLKVIVVGAGISGILNAIKLPRLVEKLDLVIYEENGGLGGTWLENRYPGIACDIPAHMYQLSWDSNVAWSHYYASGHEILDYWRRVAQKYDVEKYMKFSSRVKEARWVAREAQWVVTIEDVATGQVVQDRSDALITAYGALNSWDWPQIPGLAKFKGSLMHSAKWDESFDLDGKTVAVIGAGSSGIQIVPSIQPKVRRIDHYVRGRTWIASPMASQELERRGVREGNFTYPLEEIAKWKSDPQAYLSYRKQIETFAQSGHEITLRGSQAQAIARAHFTNLMTERLCKKPELLPHFLPSFSPLCRRLTPGPGYLEALTEENVEVVVSPISKVNETGIVTSDGKQRDVDAIVCATGFNATFANIVPIYGVNGKQLFDRPDGTRPRTANYLSIGVDGFPNMFIILGPNSAVGAGNLLMIMERAVDYTARALRKMQLENILTMQPSVHAVNNFTKFVDVHHHRTVYGEDCTSWYKADGRVTALWPGSSLHAIKALENPRWEDFTYVYRDENETGWLGDGSTLADWNPEGDKSYYLTSAELITDAPKSV
ncbi:uncharacterized protein A1O9_08000 [Exophiala aquamarina CBS 119918]|uniref:Cyclohexanone monooxygenase n=1 Tax=Exophiala aquamarina CBS 119918 TaxID=1182545 RepID=A0A072P8J4_9EURO|nr:uncharacterized protein A1O9_08000 [Exophiala aquamarina CBS 119918]KEF56419.1 hypothetical protein A1O9_08000 [Exophiala aquamarina CBS 119918]